MAIARLPQYRVESKRPKPGFVHIKVAGVRNDWHAFEAQPVAFLIPDELHGFDAAHDRHKQVHQNDVVGSTCGQKDCFRTVSRQRRGDSPSREQCRRRHPQERTVLGDQYAQMLAAASRRFPELKVTLRRSAKTRRMSHARVGHWTHVGTVIWVGRSWMDGHCSASISGEAGVVCAAAHILACPTLATVEKLLPGRCQRRPELVTDIAEEQALRPVELGKRFRPLVCFQSALNIGELGRELVGNHDRFHRVVGARSRTHEGTGIGLALVKELVKLHGGTVSVASEVGKGSTFTVLVPLGSAHLPAKSIVNDTPLVSDAVSRSVFVDEGLRAEKSSSGEPLLADGRATPSASRSTEHILVVDDNTDMREYIRKLVGRYWSVTSASDGEEALAAIARDKPDLVITDMMMPNMDGRGLIQHIRTNPATESLPVVVLSAQAGDEARVAGLQQGADDYLVKPFSARELLARIEVQLMRSRLLRTDEIRNRRLADIFREAPVGVALLKGPDHVYEFANAVHTEFLAGRGVIGLPIRRALPELHGQGIFELLDSVYASGKTYKGHSFPIEMLDSESGQLKRRYFEFVYQPLWDDSETPTGIAVVGIDVTELMSARLGAEAANRTKDEFMAILGHELRNPLAPILAALELMKRRLGDAGLRERQIIERQVRHMVRLVEDLLDIARITRGTLELKLERLELSTVVERAVETASPLLEKKRQTIELDVPAQGLELYGDTVRLCQVVSNLLTNACKFTNAEGLIAVKGWRDQANLILSIRDSGIGLEEEELGRIFGLFEQGQQELHRPQGGLGLGLAIAKSIATAHEGSISVHSAGRGLGSEFTLRLPRFVEKADEAEPGEVTLATTREGRRVLLVDDNPDVATLVAALLEEVGYEVLVAPDGPTALALVAEKGPVDVALLDIGLPKMDGYELALHLRQTDAGKAIRLVAMSGYAQASHMARAESSRFDSLLVKPVGIEDLIKAVEGSAA